MVEIVKQNYDENRKTYLNFENILREKIGNNVQINQVGSTVIPDMYGKNIIDILVGAIDSTDFDRIKNDIETLNFVASNKSKDDIYQFFSSTSEETGSGDIHIHLVIIDTDRYNDFLILREYLLANKEEAKEYSNLKINLIGSGIDDRREYKKLKSEYVVKLLERARDWKLKN